MSFANDGDWFGPSVDDLREEHERKVIDQGAARRQRIAAHEAKGGKPVLRRPVVGQDDWVTGEDVTDMQLFEDYQAEGYR